MVRVTSDAIVLRRIPYRESSQIAEFLTKEHGRVSLILKGVHRPKDRKGGGVDLLELCRVTWTEHRKSRSLAPLIERSVVSHHPGIRKREDLVRSGMYLVELLRAMAPEHQRLPGMFSLSVAFLSALNEQPEESAVETMRFALDGGLIRIAGFEYVLDRCVSCDKRPKGFRTLKCDLEKGGIVCSSCRESSDTTFSLSMDSSLIIVRLAGADPRRLGKVPISKDVRRDIRRFFLRALTHILERPPRCTVTQ
ncbi:MAG: DNA repair protein RecO [Planctomycetota bacterium]|nr:DNA repair protein RecO [Planctomycetota bacterium]